MAAIVKNIISNKPKLNYGYLLETGSEKTIKKHHQILNEITKVKNITLVGLT